LDADDVLVDTQKQKIKEIVRTIFNFTSEVDFVSENLLKKLDTYYPGLGVKVMEFLDGKTVIKKSRRKSSLIKKSRRKSVIKKSRRKSVIKKSRRKSVIKKSRKSVIKKSRRK